MICRALLVYCVKHYKGDEKIKSFIWELITPTKDGQAQTLQNHSGEGCRAVPAKANWGTSIPCPALVHVAVLQAASLSQIYFRMLLVGKDHDSFGSRSESSSVDL